MNKIRLAIAIALIGPITGVARASFYYTNTGDEPEDVYYWSQKSVDVSTSVTTTTHESGYEIYIEEDGAGGGATYTSEWDFYSVESEENSYELEPAVATLVTVEPGESENHPDEFDAPTLYVDEYLRVQVFHAEGYSAGGCWVYHEYYNDIEIVQSGTRTTTTVTNYW